MRRFVLAALLCLAPAGALAKGDPNIGCGPGTEIWLGNTGVFPMVFGATTNGTLGFQTFGITFGTLGCQQGGTVRMVAAIQTFADANLDALARDMAHGDGEALAALATLWGVSEADRPAFYDFTKRNFAQIWSGDIVTSTAMLDSLNALLAEDPRLGVYARS
jgi:hypothetical protein